MPSCSCCPCIIGLLLGVPLVAGELDDGTNRLAWTQRVTRTRWFLTKFCVVALPAVVLVRRPGRRRTLVVPTRRRRSDPAPSGSFAPYAWSERIHPTVFTVLGIVPVAYTLLAVALGAAVGAVLRRTPRAVVATIVVYFAALAVMALVVRPTLTPVIFLSDQAAVRSPLYAQLYQDDGSPWMTGQGFRFVPGSAPPAGASADELGVRCDNRAADVDACYAAHHIEHGSTYLPTSRFWALQWRESALVIAAATLLLAAGLWSVRRWRA